MVQYAFNNRLKENLNSLYEKIQSDDGLEFSRERTASSKFQIDESNDYLVQRLTKGRGKQDVE